MGFIIRNNEKTLVVEPSLLAGFFGHKLIIDKKYLKKGVRIIDLVKNTERKMIL